MFTAFFTALNEDPVQNRADAEALVEAASAASGVEELCELSAVKDLAAQENLLHSRFLAIGVFRLLELAKVTEPAALESLVKATTLNMDFVNRDLLTYKGLLSKLNSAKELEQEFLAREKKQEAE